MYFGQVTQFLEFPPISCARGSIWGALNDIPNPLENMSIPSSPSSSLVETCRGTSNEKAGTSETSLHEVQDEVEQRVDQDGGSATARMTPVEEDVSASAVSQQPQEDSEASVTANIRDEMSPAIAKDGDDNSSKTGSETVEAPKEAVTQEDSDHDSSAKPEADEESGSEGEWSDEKDEDNEGEEAEEDDEEEDGPPMLGHHKVTRGPTSGQEDHHDLPMLGHYKVTRPGADEESGSEGEWSDEGDEDNEGEEAEEDDEEEEDGPPMLGHHKVTRGPTSGQEDEDKETKGQEGDEKRANRPRRPSNFFPGIENAEKTYDEMVGDALVEYLGKAGTKPLSQSMWASKPDTVTPSAPNQASPKPVEDEAYTHARNVGTKPLSQSRWAPKPDTVTPSAPNQAPPRPVENGASPQARNASKSGGLSRAPPRGPANLSHLVKPQPPPGAPTAPRGHAWRNPGPASSGSGIQTSGGLRGPDTPPRVQLPTSPSCGLDNPDVTPRVRLPAQPMASQAKSTPVTPATIGTQSPIAFGSLSNPPYQGSPLRNEMGVASFKQDNGTLQQGNGVSPGGTAFNNDSWSPRENGRAEQDGREPRAPVVDPIANTARETSRRPEAEDDFKILGASRRGAYGGQDRRGGQSPPANGPRAEPTTPVAVNGNRSPAVDMRGRGTGPAGRGGYQAGRQHQGPAGPTYHNNNQTPPGYRGGGYRGQGPPTPRSGPTRSSKSANATSESVQRTKANIARAAAEEAKKQK